MKHPYDPASTCDCKRCARERTRRGQQSRTTPEVMLDWTASRNPRRTKVAREYWDDFQSGRPMSSDDY